MPLEANSVLGFRKAKPYYNNNEQAEKIIGKCLQSLAFKVPL